MENKISANFFSELFEKIAFGILIIDLQQEKVIYQNNYASLLLEKHEENLLTTIIANLKEQVWSSELRDVILKAEEKIYIGYSLYQVDENIYAVFLKDISSKEIYLESQRRSHFFNHFSGVIAEIAHEIGNPLTTINTTLQVTMNNIKKWPLEKTEDFLTRSIKEIERLNEFLKKMRSFALQQKLELAVHKLLKIVSDVLLHFEIEFKLKKISLQIDVDPELEVLVDENALHQILVNLVKNSLEAFAGSQSGIIKIISEEVDHFYLKLIYLNNGPEIPPEMLEKIFTPLFSTKESGRGIGLPLCQKLLTAMGGTIKAVVPRQNFGAEFHLYLPKKRYHL